MNADESRAAEGAGTAIPGDARRRGHRVQSSRRRGGLHLTPQVIADIYLGKITKWNDPQIAKLNRGMKLAGHADRRVHRSDGSGTTYIFTDFLSHVSGEWKAKVGTGKSVTGLRRAPSAERATKALPDRSRNNPGAIGYVELAYAIQNQMPQATIQNTAGQIRDLHEPGGVRRGGVQAGSERDELLDRRR